MFSEQTAPIGTYDIPIDSEFHADGCMKPKNGPRALTVCSLVVYNRAFFLTAKLETTCK